MALRDQLGESIVGVDTSPAMLQQFERKAEGQGVTTVAVEASDSGCGDDMIDTTHSRRWCYKHRERLRTFGF